MNLTAAEQFFYDNAGWSFDPKTQTREQGRTSGAILLAQIERDAAQHTFDWNLDLDIDSTPPYHATWNCVARNEEGEIYASLSSIDFGPLGDPWQDSYRRVVEAELASEVDSLPATNPRMEN